MLLCLPDKQVDEIGGIHLVWSIDVQELQNSDMQVIKVWGAAVEEQLDLLLKEVKKRIAMYSFAYVACCKSRCWDR